MTVELATLLDELARRHARGEPLDVSDLLTRAGDQADQLAPLIEAFLARAPRNAPTEASKAFVRSLDDPPMLRARVAKRLRVDDVVDAIVTANDVRPEKRPKVRRYYQELESGLLDPMRVAATVWQAITTLLDRPRAALIVSRPDVTPAAPVAYHRAAPAFDRTVLPGAAHSVEAEEQDEVDRLFLGDNPSKKGR